MASNSSLCTSRRAPIVFISYSHLDREWKDRFVRHLNVSVKQGHFVQWNDEQIGAGADWYAEISAAMDAASVAVFLISADFLGSDFILREEVTRLIERREREGLRIVPVYLRKCDWEAVAWLTRMQMRPGGDRPIVRGQDHVIDDEFAEIAKEIRLLLKEIEPKPASWSSAVQSARPHPAATSRGASLRPRARAGLARRRLGGRGDEHHQPGGLGWGRQVGAGQALAGSHGARPVPRRSIGCTAGRSTSRACERRRPRPTSSSPTRSAGSASQSPRSSSKPSARDRLAELIQQGANAPYPRRPGALAALVKDRHRGPDQGPDARPSWCACSPGIIPGCS